MRFPGACVLTFVAAVAFPARAGITNIAIAPASTTPGHAVAITVNGSGPCEVDLDLGENGSKTTLTGNLPKSTQWVYLSTGTKIVSAVAKAPCNGQAQSSIQVTSPLQNLCQKIACPSVLHGPQLSHPIACTPAISSIWAVPTPGAEVFILGSCLGEPGNVKLMFPSGPVALELFNTEWYATSIHGKIPENLKGLADQKIQLRVSTHVGKSVESYPIDFIARREIRILPGTDVVWKLDKGKGSDPYTRLGDGVGWEFTVDCDWYNPPVDYDFDNGTDTLKLVLRNGWKTHHRVLDWHASSDYGRVETQDGFLVGSTDLTLSYRWRTDDAIVPFFGGSDTYYTVTLFIEGPAGVSWR